MYLAAADQGVDSLVWGGAAVAARQDAELRGLLGVPEGFEPLLAASFGYAMEPEAPKKHVIAVSRV